MSSTFEQTEVNRVRRVPKRGHYDRETVYGVVDAAWVGHVAFHDKSTQRVTVIPMLHARNGNDLIFHGAKSSRLMKWLGSGEPLSIGFTLIDGLVLAKSLFHHSMNYRSAVVFGIGHAVDTQEEVTEALRILSEKVAPGRWDDAREPADREVAATAVVRVRIESASAKIRTGGPVEEPEDESLPVWSGILPLSESAGMPIADTHSVSLPVPDYLTTFRRQLNERST